MAGLICITPLVSLGLDYTIVPFYRMLHLDPGMLGGILALDMGGYQLCKELALDPAIGRYGGIIVGATLGCTITFTIPVGMGMLGEREKPLFAKGILAGLSALPVGILVGGLLCGLSIGKLLIQSIPVFLLAVLLILGLSRFPDGMIRGFRVFAEIIRGAGTIGIALGAFSYMTGVQLLPEMTGLDEALGVVSSIGIVLLGSLPFAEILQRLLNIRVRTLATTPAEKTAGMGGREDWSWTTWYCGTSCGNCQCLACDSRYETDERERNRDECSSSGVWNIHGGSTSRICPGCGCSGDRSTSGWKTDRGHCRSLDGMADHEKD